MDRKAELPPRSGLYEVSNSVTQAEGKRNDRHQISL
jgi:hypothetical protein